jgi:hypothetical protein
LGPRVLGKHYLIDTGNSYAVSLSNMRGGSNRLIGSGRHWLMAAPTAEHRYVSGGHWRTPDSIESQ